MSFTDPDLSRAAHRSGLDRARLGIRRAVLRHRRLLAAAFAATAVWAGLAAVAEPSPATIPVLVAARDLPAGTALTTADLTSAGFRPGTAPADAVADTDGAVGRLLAAPVTAGEPITSVRLVGAALAAAHPGRRAVPVRLPDAGAVSLLEVGDQIDLVAVDPEDGQVSTAAADVPVLALPVADDGGPAGATALPGSLVVVGLTPGEIAPVASAVLRDLIVYTWSNR